MIKQKAILMPLIFIVLFFAYGCASSPPKPTVYSPQFIAPAFSAEGGNTEMASSITIALVNPSYARPFSGEIGELFQQSLGKDIEKILIEKGYRLLGPFQSINDMTFPQKKQSDLILSTVMDFNFQEPLRQQEVKTDWAGVALGGSSSYVEYFWAGPCSMSGFISFEVFEPISYQKMWTKKVDVPSIKEDCTAQGAEMYQVVAYNAAGKLIEQIYKDAVSKANIYFNVEEMDMVRKQSLELREKKVY